MKNLNKLVCSVLLVLLFSFPIELFSNGTINNNIAIDWNMVSNIPINNDSIYSQSYYENLLADVFHEPRERGLDGFSYKRIRINDFGDCILVKFQSQIFDNFHTFILMNPEKQAASCFHASDVSKNKKSLQLTYNVRGRISHTLLIYNSNIAEFEVIDSWREWIDEDKIVSEQIKNINVTINNDSLPYPEFLSSINAIPDFHPEIIKKTKQRELVFQNMRRCKLIEYDLYPRSLLSPNKIYILDSELSQKGIFVFVFNKIKIKKDVIILYYKQRNKLYPIKVSYDSHSNRFFRIEAD